VLPVEEVREEPLVLLEQTATKKGRVQGGQVDCAVYFLQDQAELLAGLNARAGEAFYVARQRVRIPLAKGSLERVP
jgi:hypothetical protein